MNVLEFSALIGLGSLLAGFLGALTGLGGGVVVVPMLAPAAEAELAGFDDRQLAEAAGESPGEDEDVVVFDLADDDAMQGDTEGDLSADEAIQDAGVTDDFVTDDAAVTDGLVFDAGVTDDFVTDVAVSNGAAAPGAGSDGESV